MNLNKILEIFFRFLKVSMLVFGLGLLFGFYHSAYPAIDFTMVALVLLLALWFERYWLQDCKEIFISSPKKRKR